MLKSDLVRSDQLINRRWTMFQTIGYKKGFIHLSHVENHEVVRVQVDGYAYAVQVKSLHAAKILISKHAASYGGAKWGPFII